MCMNIVVDFCFDLPLLKYFQIRVLCLFREMYLYDTAIKNYLESRDIVEMYVSQRSLKFISSFKSMHC